MNTPICDFVEKYAKKKTLRMHMPGHKGYNLLGFEEKDITEIDGADSLFEASTIIKESENNASSLFGTAKTLYSTEGSSLSIKAMLYLAKLYAIKTGKKHLILSARNAHKTFVFGAGLLNLKVEWLKPSENSSYLTFSIDSMESLESQIIQHAPVALYITSPDYLGNIADIESIGKVCKKHGVLLLVDNAHGAYLKFLTPSKHPIDLGCDICCDSAHKTLPCLTGGGYLHLSKSLPDFLLERGKDAMALFASTSPSYLIMQSLDKVNEYLDGGYREKLSTYISFCDKLKSELIDDGFVFSGDEPLKWTFKTKEFGYTGTDFSKLLIKNNIVPEFYDNDFVVLMLSPNFTELDMLQLKETIKKIGAKPKLKESEPQKLHIPKRKYEISDALYSDSEEIATEDAKGRVLATVNVSCPPAVPIAVCGEVIDGETVERFLYYNIKSVRVIKE